MIGETMQTDPAQRGPAHGQPDNSVLWNIYLKVSNPTFIELAYSNLY